MNLGTYGLADVIPKTPSYRGPTVPGMLQKEQQETMGMVNSAAAQEQQRNLANQQQEQEAKAGNAQLGATVGAIGGTIFGGPMGASIGASLGGLVGGLF